jgi:hypothetical protein
MFALAVGGNLTYACSILFGGNIMESLPFLVGSLGTLFFDFIVFGQFWVYRSGDEPLPFSSSFSGGFSASRSLVTSNSYSYTAIAAT